MNKILKLKVKLCCWRLDDLFEIESAIVVCLMFSMFSLSQFNELLRSLRVLRILRSRPRELDRIKLVDDRLSYEVDVQNISQIPRARTFGEISHNFHWFSLVN